MSSASLLSASRPHSGAEGVRRIATGLLIGLTLVFLGTHAVEAPSTLVLLIRAMAEAGMIGAIADWFAVEALFRRPLGLPIPHTALLPRNQARAADNIARFIDEFFLAPDQILGRIKDTRPTEQVARWLSDPAHARAIAADLTGFAQVVFRSGNGAVLSPELRQRLGTALTAAADPDDLSRRLAQVLRQAFETEFTAEAMRGLRATIEDNRPALTRIAQEKSRWWIAGSVDRQVVALLLDAVNDILLEVGTPKSEMGREVRGVITDLITRLDEDGTLARLIRDLIAAAPGGTASEAALGDVQGDILSRLRDQLEDDPEIAAGLVAEALQSTALSLTNDPARMRRLDLQVSDGLMSILTALRPGVVSYISQTIKAWDSEMLVDRIEREVGRDLQFIRINGAVLGALVGGAIFGVTQGFHP